MDKKKRNISLDLLKLISCIAVVGLHVFTYDYNSHIVNYFHYLFGYAVPVFFMVNGYLILNKKEVTIKYAFNKVYAILKVVVLWNLLVFLKYLILNHQFLNPVSMVLRSLLQHGDLWQFWFLGAMMFTYVCAPFIHKFVYGKKYGYIILLSILTLMNMVQLVIDVIYARDFFGGYGNTVIIWRWLLFFSLGGYMKNVTIAFNNKIGYKPHMVATVSVFVIFPLYQEFIGKAWNYNDYYFEPVALVNVFLLFTFIMRIKTSEKVSDTIVFLSSLGMGCYIIHPLVIRVVGHFINSDIPLIAFILFPAITAFSMLIAYVLKKIPVARIWVNL